MRAKNTKPWHQLVGQGFEKRTYYSCYFAFFCFC